LEAAAPPARNGRGLYQALRESWLRSEASFTEEGSDPEFVRGYGEQVIRMLRHLAA
jgi:hypothetical protein